MREAEEHIRFVFELYSWQEAEGRLWLHEHPDGASSWKLDFVEAALRRPGVMRVKGHMCPWGMTSTDVDGSTQLVLKATGWATNSKRIAQVVSKQCDNPGKSEDLQHRHATLTGGRAKACEVYPVALVKAILEALLLEMEERMYARCRGARAGYQCSVFLPTTAVERRIRSHWSRRVCP